MNKSGYEQFVRAIDWKKLRGAHGSKYSIADDLVKVVSVGELDAYQVLGQIMAHACHQNVLSAPAPQVASCLLRIPDIEGLTHSWIGPFGVSYLFSAAWSTSRDFGFPPRMMPFAGEQPPKLPKSPDRKNPYDTLSSRLLEALEEAVPRICLLLTHPDSRMRAQSARLLAIGGRTDELIPKALIAAHEKEANDEVRGGLLLALASRISGTGKPGADLVDRLHGALTSAGPLESIGAAAALLILDPEKCLDQHSQVVKAGLHFETDKVPFLLMREFPWAHGRIPDLMAEALARAPIPDVQAVDLAIEAAAYWSPKNPKYSRSVEWSDQELIAMRILQRTFHEHLGRRDYLQASDLSPFQCSIATKLAPLAIDAEVFEAYGFRDLGLDANRLFGQTKGGLDRQLDGVFDNQSVRWPLWKWWHQSFLMDHWGKGRAGVTPACDQFLSRMKQELSPEEIFRAAEDAASGAYEVPHAPLVRLVMAVADKVASQLESYSNGIGPSPTGAQSALAVVPALALAAGRTVSWLEHVRPWIDRITPKDLKSEALELARRCP